jgi:hypothetical protein
MFCRNGERGRRWNRQRQNSIVVDTRRYSAAGCLYGRHCYVCLCLIICGCDRLNDIFYLKVSGLTRGEAPPSWLTPQSHPDLRSRMPQTTVDCTKLLGQKEKQFADMLCDIFSLRKTKKIAN